MKTIFLKKLTLVNFKGIRNLTIKFGKETGIYGANGTGKTTVFDAFCFILFGKDSTDRTNFEIKTLDPLNNPIPKIDHEVEALITVDGEEINIKRTFREKWVKKRGALESEFGGNETLYYWNDVPMTLRDYTAKISNLVDESVFKLITSPTAFNSLKWQDQRQVLIDITGGVTDYDVAKGNPDFEKLMSKLTNKSLEEYQKQIASSIRKAKDEIKMIPTRIDEVQRNKPEAIDFTEVRRDLAANEKELASLENQISDKVAAQQEILNRRQDKQQEIYSLKSDLQKIEFEARQEAQRHIQKESSAVDNLTKQLSDSRDSLQKSERTLAQLKAVLKNEQGDIELYEQKNDHIRAEWNKRNADEFKMDENACKCPTCERAFDAEDVEAKKKEFFANFQKAKMQDLEELSKKGKRNKEKIEAAKQEVETLIGRISKGEALIENLNSEVDNIKTQLEAEKNRTEVKSQAEIVEEILEKNAGYWTIQTRIGELEEALKNEEGVDMQDLKEKKAKYLEAISQIKSRLQAEEQIKQADKRIADLQKEESDLAQQIADYERDQFTIEQFIKAKIDKLEGMINERFRFVNFKLFETQVNGGEVPTCKALINGVPFSDANTASKINAGIDIINTLCDHYRVSAPIFIDNRESVVDLIDSQSQIINLIVSGGDKKLRVEAPELAEAV
ncbi:AAA domain-containing protein [Salinimicrobium sediminis]|uniref:AAA domain-containing protein n=1 Tax=Salinimicrobium sediminis TaxID=1343891 RepID=A0A285X3A7_9FLAO|nr:AAA family ATPase [Salinimicrobium sediminis]SOC79850.1 AAA domain-containing protein [Salinimicrobium sediminis]